MTYQIHLPVFEGPFELLFHLIERDEVNLWDIPIAHITDQYLEYIESLSELDLNLAGEFLVMAATLLAIKARMLLPQPEQEPGQEVEEEGDPRLALVTRLLEYRRFKEAASTLAQLAAGRDRLFPRGQVAVPDGLAPKYTRPIGKATVSDLAAAMQSVLEAYEPPKPEVAIPRGRVTVAERVVEVRTLLAKQARLSFFGLLPPTPTRRDIVVTFLALLEIIRMGLGQAVQANPFSDIELETSQAVEEE